MGKVNQHHFPERGDYETWVDLGPDQEPDSAEIAAVAIPVLAELIAVCLFICCAFVWCGIASGRI